MFRSSKDPSETSAPPPPPPSNPVIETTRRLLAESKYVEAVTFAYWNTVQDVIRAYGLRAPKQWTHREFLTWGIRPDMGNFTNLLPRLYGIYEPVRYGEERDWRDDDLIGLLQLIYAEEPLARLYESRVFGVVPAAPLPAVSESGPGNWPDTSG